MVRVRWVSYDVVFTPSPETRSTIEELSGHVGIIVVQDSAFFLLPLIASYFYSPRDIQIQIQIHSCAWSVNSKRLWMHSRFIPHVNILLHPEIHSEDAQGTAEEKHDAESQGHDDGRHADGGVGQAGKCIDSIPSTNILTRGNFAGINYRGFAIQREVQSIEGNSVWRFTTCSCQGIGRLSPTCDA